jgi:DNA-binding winged helix-turn-helix (wHTH) protein
MPVPFGDCVFDPGTRQVLRAGKQVRISPKAFQLLEILIARRPNAVSKEELQEILWPDTYVSDANLPNLVADLRSELGDSPRSSRIIRTVQRFGYAFVATPLSARHAGSRGHAYRLIWGNREIALGEGENLFGREDDAVVWIDDAAVSRRHARIVIDESGAFLEDLGSKNGTYLRGKRLLQTPAKLTDGDQITIGTASMTFRVLDKTASTATAAEQKETEKDGSLASRHQKR